MTRPLVALVFGLLVAACGASESSKQETSNLSGDCIPNQTFPCVCGLDTGSQSCTADRKLTACECGAKKPDAPISSPSAPAPKSLCGNGTVDPGEACDDGNAIDRDGCSAACQPDGAPDDAASCPGQALSLWQGKTTTLAGTTSGFQDRFSASCGPSAGKDRRYLFEAESDGVLTIEGSFAPGFDAVIEISDGACVNGTSLLCEDTFSAPFSRTISVKANHPYFLLVDGLFGSDEGAYALKLTLQ